jgi:tRNA A-37 threonylcarbamoyl transferase component Bud32
VKKSIWASIYKALKMGLLSYALLLCSFSGITGVAVTHAMSSVCILLCPPTPTPAPTPIPLVQPNPTTVVLSTSTITAGSSQSNPSNTITIAGGSIALWQLVILIMVLLAVGLLIVTLLLSPSGASIHLPITPQIATGSIIPTRSVPEQPKIPPVPVAPVTSASGQANSIELKTPPDKNDVSVEPPSKKNVAEAQAQSNPVAGLSKPVNRRLGNYRLIRLLGNGGFADVYLGEQVYLKIHAAIKVQHIRLTKEAIKSFLNEARTIAGLVHPHIIRVLEFGLEGEEPDLEQSVLNIEGGMPFLVMDYAPGGTLRQRHPRGTRLSLDTIISYTAQVAEALEYAHQKKLIHRDIKPENMLIGSRDEILLSDFGIAVVAHSEHSMTTQQMAGTLPYMAPEQIQGKSQPASDQYSLGVVVYEWLSGIRPFQGSGAWDIMNLHLSSPPPSLREKNPAISKEVEQVVLKALSKDPRQRFASVADFAKALASAH